MPRNGVATSYCSSIFSFLHCGAKIYFVLFSLMKDLLSSLVMYERHYDFNFGPFWNQNIFFDSFRNYLIFLLPSLLLPQHNTLGAWQLSGNSEKGQETNWVVQMSAENFCFCFMFPPFAFNLATSKWPICHLCCDLGTKLHIFFRTRHPFI